MTAGTTETVTAGGQLWAGPGEAVELGGPQL